MRASPRPKWPRRPLSKSNSKINRRNPGSRGRGQQPFCTEMQNTIRASECLSRHGTLVEPPIPVSQSGRHDDAQADGGSVRTCWRRNLRRGCDESADAGPNQSKFQHLHLRGSRWVAGAHRSCCATCETQLTGWQVAGEGPTLNGTTEGDAERGRSHTLVHGACGMMLNRFRRSVNHVSLPVLRGPEAG